MDEFIGIIKLFAGNFAPRGWAFCNGAQLSIAQNSALFAIIGTTYGGNGQTTFALPNLNGRVVIGMGQSGGTSNYNQGEVTGSENVTLTTNQLPAHTHALAFSSAAATTSSPTGNVLAQTNGLVTSSEEAVTVNAYGPAINFVAGNPAAIAPAGGSQPFPVLQPSLVLNYIICMEGVFPPQSLANCPARKGDPAFCSDTRNRVAFLG
ncbi:phage tail protein [Hymenobacter terrenus]|uniref:phage tail protein n=1 Tax=Hymenobacter terrenus TaxID=1629124 RepID=UPI00090815F8|nr:tail fiber protein [Hymenobacter terrenus]